MFLQNKVEIVRKKTSLISIILGIDFKENYEELGSNSKDAVFPVMICLF